jgi:asparagine synthetase B (glutamine-hydrolysing)
VIEPTQTGYHTQAPYFYIRPDGAEFKTAGLSACQQGHKLESGSYVRPDGIFVEWSWDGQSLYLQNDRYGFYPVYYFSKPGGELAISTSIPKLVELGAPVDLDEAALAVFLRVGFFLGDDTPFKSIRAVPPSAQFTWAKGELRVSGQWPQVKANSINRTDAIDGYVSLFREAIKRRLPPSDDFALPLSGGRDSRHILFELCLAGHRPRFCLTSVKDNPGSFEDVNIARQLANVTDLTHVVLTQTGSRLKRELSKNLATGFCTDEHAWYLVITDHLGGRTTAVYDGIGGDTLSASRYLTKWRAKFFDSGHLAKLAQTFIFPYRQERLAKLLPPGKFGQELAIERITEELTRHVNAPNPVASFILANRTRREIALAPYTLLTQVGTVFSPYLDHQLYDLLASLPASMLMDRNFHTDAINRAYPQFSDIPYSQEAILCPQNYRARSQFALELMQYAYRDSRPRLIRNTYLVEHLLRCPIDKRSSEWIEKMGVLAVYLIQLEKFCQKT